MTDKEFDNALDRIYMKGILNRFEKEYQENEDEVKITPEKDVVLKTI